MLFRSGTGVWTELNPKVPRVNYIGLHFVNKDTGWAAGGSGAIIKTTNGGDDWTIAETPVNNLLLKIHSYNGEVVIVTGYDGIILRSSDGGETFEQVPSGVGTGTDLWGVQMLNDTLGWVCGMNQTLLRTTDAGISWQMATPGLNQHYWALDFLNEQYGIIAAGGGKVLKTTDGGDTWQQYQAGDTRALYTIDIIDSLHIAAAGAGGGFGGKNVYSSDGGETWIQNGNMIYENGVNSIAFINADTGYAVGNDWAIRKTTNRGVNWFASDPVYSEWSLDLLPGGVGYTGGQALRIYKTTGGYDNWEKLFFTDNLSDVYFISEQKGFIIVSDPSKLYKTTDGGMNWERVINGPGGYDILFTDSLTGYIVNNNSSIYKTTDGGSNWYLTNIPEEVGDVRRIFFINHTTGWAVTIWSPVSNAKILKTTDGGENWFVQLEDVYAGSFTSIYFVDSLNGWATRLGGRPYKTTDGGNNWIEQTNLDIWESRDVFFKDLLNGFMLESNKFYKTTDGGLNWILNPDITGFSVAAKFSYFDSNTIFIIGYKTYRTTDGGTTWQDFPDINNMLISGLSLLNPGYGFAVGDLGLMLKYNDDSIPVELTKFTASIKENKVILKWVTATETNNLGFWIQRKFSKGDDWLDIGFVEGKGTTTETNSYNFIDHQLTNAHIYYRLKQVDYDGSFTYSKIISVYFNTVPLTYQLFQNYPNPFNPTTTITFSIPEKQDVNIYLYSILGEKLKELVNEVKDPGYYEVNFNASNLASGVYFYRLVAGSFVSTHKMLLLK